MEGNGQGLARYDLVTSQAILTVEGKRYLSFEEVERIAKSAAWETQARLFHADRNQGQHHFYVPNNVLGTLFLWVLKLCLNRKVYKVVSYGRVPVKGYRRGSTAGTPLYAAKWRAVYLQQKRPARYVV